MFSLHYNFYGVLFYKKSIVFLFNKIPFLFCLNCSILTLLKISAFRATNFETFVKTLAVFIPSKQVPPVGEKHAINSNMQKVKSEFDLKFSYIYFSIREYYFFRYK